MDQGGEDPGSGYPLLTADARSDARSIPTTATTRRIVRPAERWQAVRARTPTGSGTGRVTERASLLSQRRAAPSARRRRRSSRTAGPAGPNRAPRRRPSTRWPFRCDPVENKSEQPATDPHSPPGNSWNSESKSSSNPETATSACSSSVWTRSTICWYSVLSRSSEGVFSASRVAFFSVRA